MEDPENLQVQVQPLDNTIGRLFLRGQFRANAKISTERLVLRAFQTADATAVQELAADRAIANFTAVPHPYPPGLAHAWIATHAADFAARKAVTFAIVSKAKENNYTIGSGVVEAP